MENQLEEKIRNFIAGKNPLEAKIWTNISFSLTVVDDSVKRFSSQIDPILSAGAGKLIVMELWTIKELLETLNHSTAELDAIAPDLKGLRDAYAHIKERLKGYEKPFRQPQAPLQKEKSSLANGALTSKDGKHWEVTGMLQTMFNLSFDSDGVSTVFGIMNDFLICSSAGNMLELQINQKLLDDVYSFIDGHL